jgi:hypothetical protein
MVAAAAGELSPAPSVDALKALARTGPVLATVDNVQWADLATAQALRPMPRLLASYPLSWILAMGTSSDGRPAEQLFDPLESDRAAGSATRTRSRSHLRECSASSTSGRASSWPGSRWSTRGPRRRKLHDWGM